LVNSIINDILNGPGNAQHKLERIYGKHLSYHNAALYLAGIKSLGLFIIRQRKYFFF